MGERAGYTCVSVSMRHLIVDEQSDIEFWGLSGWVCVSPEEINILRELEFPAWEGEDLTLECGKFFLVRTQLTEPCSYVINTYASSCCYFTIFRQR